MVKSTSIKARSTTSKETANNKSSSSKRRQRNTAYKSQQPILEAINQEVSGEAGNYTAEQHRPLFWRRLATQLSPLTVPQLYPFSLSLKGVLPKDYNRPVLDKHRLGELIKLIDDIELGDATNRAKDILCLVYECFLSTS